MSTASPLRTRLRAALLDARRARDAETVSTLRTAIAALENAEAVPAGPGRVDGGGGGDGDGEAPEDAVLGVGATEAARHELDDAEERAVLDAEIAALGEAARAYACSAPERAVVARRAAGLLTRLRDA
ncbi:GatB/YqeY domain-containing protein [Nocardioides flavus (ex Wang et al. 2016)]|nr:hypothetical protein [Nocardioides flavus (ex Wang et al. 2016)]